MQIAVLTPTGFEIREAPVPSPGPGEVLLKTLACGVCSGDVFVYRNRETLAATHSRLGHEGSGIVTRMGRDVTGFAEGDIVTALGDPAYAEYYIVTPDNLVKLPPEIDPRYALGEAVACCVHAGNRFGIRPGDRVAVVGCGFMGLICLQLARYQGAAFICTIDPLAYRREMAEQLSAEAALGPFEQEAQAIVQQYGTFDVVIEAAGTQSALDLCTALVGLHGRIVLIGYHQSHGGMRDVDPSMRLSTLEVLYTTTRKLEVSACLSAKSSRL